MADKKLNAVDSATTVANFYGNNGGQDVQIPLAAAASVLADAIGNPLSHRGQFQDVADLSDQYNEGIYTLRSSDGMQGGVMLIFSLVNIKIQIQCGIRDDSKRILRYRTTTVWGDSYSDWVDCN